MAPQRVPVLMYHAIDERASPIAVTPRTFERHMELLEDRGIDVIPLAHLAEALRANVPLPERCAAITFDDGIESVYTHAAPVLAKHGFPATAFLVAGFCGKWNDWPSQPAGAERHRLMGWEQIEELDRSGFEFGVHTFTHPRLDRLNESDLAYEVVESKETIEQRLGHVVGMFAYPYGRSDDASRSLVESTYSGACTARLGYVNPASGPMQIDRVDAYYVQHPALFRAISNPAFPLYLSLRRSARAAASKVLRRAWA